MQDIFSYITTEENLYRTTGVAVSDNYEWSMFKHIALTIAYKNSIYYESGKSEDKPFKNIIRPILNLQYRAEGFDVKDIQLFINDVKQYYKSLLLRKFHEKWARENELDTFIDEMVESYVDFGGALIKNARGVRPEVVPFQRLAFCDQTDILSGPICEKHQFSPVKLLEMKDRGWENIEDLIILSEARKEEPQTPGISSKTPGKYIEVYELHGQLPTEWLSDNQIDTGEETEYSNQLHVVAFYKDKDNIKHGITLFKGKEKTLPYKLILRDKIYGRALGLGGAEELFEPQIWTNYDIIRMNEMLDFASKVILQTADKAFANRNRLANLQTGEILVHDTNEPLTQVNTTPVNITLFERSVAEWEAHARQMGSAQEAIMGDQPPAGTPFKSVELQAIEGHSIHEYRRGKIATFLDTVYRDWIIPHLSKEVSKKQEFLADLDLNELKYVADALVLCQTNDLLKEQILNGEIPDEAKTEAFKQKVRDSFMKGGSKKFISILEGEMKDAPIDVEVNIAGKQKNIPLMVDKLVNVFRQIIAAPQLLQTPQGADLFNQIIEYSGLNPIDFTGFTVPQPSQQIPDRQPLAVGSGLVPTQ